MQHAHSQKRQNSEGTKITPIRATQPVIHFNTFGAFLRFLREREQIPLNEIAAPFEEFFQEYGGGVPALTPDMYRKLEKGKRALQFEEILPLYASLAIGHGYKLSSEERAVFVRLAREKLEGLQRRRPKLRPQSEWRLLEIQLAQLDQDVPAEEANTSEQTRGSKTSSQQKFSFDVSHILGREEWRATMLSYLLTAKKLVVVQGMMGTGKTSGLKFLLQSLLEIETYLPLFYTFTPSSNATPDDHLDTFLATILAELHVAEPESAKAPPLAKRIEQVLELLAETEQRVILLVDDAQIILDQQSQLTEGWKAFLTAFLKHRHQSVIYLSTREWPLWTGRERSFVVDGDEAMLPSLSPEAGAEIWKRLGFTDVSEDLLRQATMRCGGNALMIELRAASLRRPRFSFSWKRSAGSAFQQENKSEHQQLIEQLLAESHVFGAADIEARQLLQQVVSNRLTYDALQLLEVLSVSPVPLPFPLLIEINQQAEYAFIELLKASLIDQSTVGLNERAQLQPLVREAGIEKLLNEGRISEVEHHLVSVYNVWLAQGIFHSEQEQASLITELAVLYLKQHDLFKAAELLLEHGWLSFAFGHASRLARIADEVMRSFNWYTPAENEIGGQLLQYHLLARSLDKNLGAPERKEAYLHLYEVMKVGTVSFGAAIIVHLVHHKLRYLVTDKHYAEAWALIDEACKRYEGLKETKPVTYAELLDRQGYVLGRWGDSQNADGNVEEALRLRQESVNVHLQCITLLRQYKRFASPIEQSHIRFKLARLLNDLSYYQRCVGLLEDAREAMEECLRLKEAGLTVPSSMAISYDDYGQLLGQLGNFEEALSYNDRALQIEEQLMLNGHSSALREKGMMLINRGKLLLLIGRLGEAQALFQEGIPLVKGTSRDVKVADATKGLGLIDLWHKENPQHQLDWRWSTKYGELAAYSDIRWLTQAGSFLVEEQREWDALVEHRDDEEVSKRLLAIAAQARSREIAASLQEQREPHFHYPFIPLESVQSRIAGFLQLRAVIEKDEPNYVVRNLYLSTIDERITELRMIAATAQGDDDTFRRHNERLNSKPTHAEMEMAVIQILSLVRRGLDCSDTSELSNRILQQLQRWGLVPINFRHLRAGDKSELTEGQSASCESAFRKVFSPHIMERFFSDVLRRYEFDWSVSLDPSADHASVSPAFRKLTLPADKPMTSAKIRELLGHEIEIHAFRASSGTRSPLALLGSGLGGYLDTEEGLALYYAQEVARYNCTEVKAKSWIGTLASGLASGVGCPPVSFRTLLLFVESTNVLRGLLNKRGAPLAEIQNEARKGAISRCLRTYRGVSHLEIPGACSTKDSVYLRGFLAVSQAIEENPKTFDQLMVGSVGLQHLTDLAKLGIVTPSVTHLHLATDPHLEVYIEQFAD